MTEHPDGEGLTTWLLAHEHHTLHFSREHGGSAVVRCASPDGGEYRMNRARKFSAEDSPDTVSVSRPMDARDRLLDLANRSVPGYAPGASSVLVSQSDLLAALPPSEREADVTRLVEAAAAVLESERGWDALRLALAPFLMDTPEGPKVVDPADAYAEGRLR